ncbi:MAG: DUF4266 domain-containing protein [Gammaproteobacteria bacterium]|nr:DUF4266 domain-containing protein [Gammaproteobacteria bacterium]MDH3372611.1 DUF4266 domain-containing protein [Gammaproteobacteria bacterium]MDH3409749.1 DUF4266 domain-containing protein [Gammaproteobacteria bacterium]MDH3552948.1 DUF4266 domain-containing protein [Gammaproteobacteria bacterium]
MKIRALSRYLLLFGLLAGAAGCSNFEPWVKPYERDRLADPIMALDTAPVSSSYIQHVYEAREGARGGEGAAGGGCGCN